MALAAAGSLAEVGVEAVVEGLKGFQQAFSFMNDQMDKFAGKGSFLSKAFAPVNKVLGGFFDSIKRIGEFVAAGIILKGLDKITESLVNMAKEAFNTAVGFQDLRIRLERFMAIDIAQDKGYNSVVTALREAKEPAQELFGWLSKLAVTTPFDIQDIADTLTMAKTYGFATEEAKMLTESIIDFAAGMGLGGDEMNRVIKALGQMKSLGRVAGQELLQLANAGVPVEDILVKVAENLGITRKQLEKLRMQGLIPATKFFEAFNEVMGYRFAGAAEVAGKSLKSVLGNIKDLTQNVLGFNIALPIVDAFSGKLNELVEAFTKPEVFDKFWAATERIGEAFKGIIQGLFILADFDASSFAEGIVNWLDELGKKLEIVKTAFLFFASGGMNFDELANVIGNVFNIDPEKITKFADFVEKIAGIPQKIRDIVSAFQEGGFFAGLTELGVPQPIINFIGDIIAAFSNLKKFFEDNGPALQESLDKIIGSIAGAMGIQDTEGESIIEKIGEIIRDLSIKVLESAPGIVENFGKIANAIADPENGFVAKIGKFVDWIDQHEDEVLAFMKNVGLGMAAFYTFSKLFALAAAAFGLTTFAVLGRATGFKSDMESTFGDRPFWSGLAFSAIDAMTFGFLTAIQTMISAVKNKLGIHSPSTVFRAIGSDLMEGFKQGILDKAKSLASAAVSAAQGVINGVLGLLGIHSPSKVFAGIGQNMMAGMAMGITKGMGLPMTSMMNAIGAISRPAMSPVQSSIVNQNTTNNNFNLNVNTQAKAEPVIADFRMLQSFAGGS